MTAATVSGKARDALAAPPRRKAEVGFGDLFALTLRQNRLAIGLCVLMYVLFGLLVLTTNGQATIGYWRFDPKEFTLALAVVIAMFWGAPLLATEYEQRTSLVVWSQDVTPLRWLLAKLTLLGGLVAVLSGLLSIVVGTQAAAEADINPVPFSALEPYGLIGYEAWLPLSLVYALFGFFFGVAVGGLVRRTVNAIGITLVGFVGIRLLVMDELRPWLLAHLITPVRVTWPLTGWVTLNPSVAGAPGAKDYIVNFDLWLNAAGRPVAFPDNCGSLADKPFVSCMAAHGIVTSGQDFQPASRILAFQSVELALYVVLIAVSIGLAVWSLRRKAIM